MVCLVLPQAPSEEDLGRIEKIVLRWCSQEAKACWEQLCRQWEQPTPTLDGKLVLQLAQHLEHFPRECYRLAELVADLHPKALSLAQDVFFHAVVGFHERAVARSDLHPLLQVGEKLDLHRTNPELLIEVLRLVVREPGLRSCAELERMLPLLPPCPEVAAAWWIVEQQKGEQGGPQSEPPDDLFLELPAVVSEKMLPPRRLRQYEQWLRTYWKQRGHVPLELIPDSKHATYFLEASRCLPLEGKWLLELIHRYDLWPQTLRLLNSNLPPDASLYHPLVVQQALERLSGNTKELGNALSRWAASAPWETLRKHILEYIFQEYFTPEEQEYHLFWNFVRILQHPQRSFTKREFPKVSPSGPPPQRPWLIVIAPPRKLAGLLWQEWGEPLLVSQLHQLLPWLRMGPTGEGYVVLYCPRHPEKLPDRHPFYHWLPQRKRFSIVALPPELAPTHLQLTPK